MRKITGRLTTMVAMTLAASATAQDRRQPQPALPGRAIEGRLSSAEVRHPLRLKAGETVRIAARSRDFDPMLKIYGPTGTESLADDDDSGGGTTAELTFQAERAGLYQVGVSVSGESDAPSDPDKAYDLTVIAAAPAIVRPAQAITPNAAQPIAVNTGQCGAGCRFTFQATEGERLIAETSGGDNDADPVLELSTGSEKLAEDDDGGEGVNARIIRRIERTGTYTLLARTLNGNRGQFTLSVALTRPVARPAIPLVVGTPATGRISGESELSDEGKFYNGYTLHGRAGQRVVIDLESSDFDAELRVFGESVLGNVQLATNDDADRGAANRSRPQTLNSHLALTFKRDGDVEVRAISLTDEGAYTLRVGEPTAR